jgi:polyferredoxin
VRVAAFQALADAVLVVHFALVVFIVGGLAFIVAGGVRHWPLAANFWFRAAHLAAIAVVAVQAWLGEACPLTTLESWLRAQAGAPGYEKSFIEHWLQRIVFYEAPIWVFALAYTLFALAVAWAWWRYPPRCSHERSRAP